MQPLALKYRPQNFDDLVGQPAAQIILRQMIKLKAVPNALLFDGCHGTGKTTTARIVAAALNCHADNAPCGTCPSCAATFDGSSLDVLEIDAASNGLVDDVRALRQQILHRHNGDYRIIIFDEAHSASTAAFNAWLKTLEEPPEHTVLIFITTERHKIPDTIASRCMPFTFHRVTTHDITNRLTHIARTENRPADPDLIRLIAERARGAMRDAIMRFDQVTRVGMTTAEQYTRLLGHADHAATILSPLAAGKLPEALTALDQALTRVADPHTLSDDLTTFMRDVLVLRCGGDIDHTGTALADRQNLALTLETPTVIASMKILWQLRAQRGDARTNLELGLVLLAEILKPAQVPARLSLADMANRA